MNKYICHFSAGATSAISTYLTIQEHGNDNCLIIYADPGQEHPDNMRFIADCERILFDKKVIIVRSKKNKTPIEVFEKRKFIVSPYGAPCTAELKKIPIRDYLGQELYEKINVYGFDPSEKKRIERFQINNPEIKVKFPLVEKDIRKIECKRMLIDKGLKLPKMYDLGYRNANCAGCVKAGSISYWKAIKKDFPEIFKRYEKLERELNATICKKVVNGETHRVFLDMIDNEKAKIKREQPDMFCGYSCG